MKKMGMNQIKGKNTLIASAAYVDAFLIFTTFSDIIATWGTFGILIRLPLSWKRRQAWQLRIFD